MATVVWSLADILSLESSCPETVSAFHFDSNVFEVSLVRVCAYQRHFVAMQLIEKPVMILKSERRPMSYAEEFCLS